MQDHFGLIFRSLLVGDHQLRTISTKDLPHQVVFSWGWCANCRNLRERRNAHPYASFALAMLIIDFVGVVRGFCGLILEGWPKDVTPAPLTYAASRARGAGPRHLDQKQLWRRSMQVTSTCSCRWLFRKRVISSCEDAAELTTLCA